MSEVSPLKISLAEYSQTTSVSPENLLKIQLLRPTPDPLNQKLEEWAQESVFQQPL